MIRNRSILLILCLNFLVLIVFHYLVLYHKNNIMMFGRTAYPHMYSGWCLFPLLILYPLMGWLADTRYGRYRMIKTGMWVMWLASILSSALAVLKFKWQKHHDVVFSSFDAIFFIVLSLGLSLFHANIIQFGIDQLVDASSVQITSYVNWYTWTFFASEVMIDFSQHIVVEFYFAFTLVLPLFLTVALLLVLFFGKYLVVEPVTCSPLKLILYVLRYAAKNKYPRQRSAFTYWEDKPYSRIDLAKRKYGGPFTVEEVENVKSFFRILALICIMAAFVGLGYNYVGLLPKVRGLDGRQKDTLACLKSAALLNLGSILVVVVIPVYEIVIFPLCSNCLLTFTSRKKFSAGIMCWGLDLLAHVIISSFGKHSTGTSKWCTLTYVPNNYLIVIPAVFECFSRIWLFGASLEFVCAQAPYSMKGLIFGMMYALSAIFSVLAFVGFLPFHYVFRKVSWQKAPLNCGFWFFAINGGVSFFFALCFLVFNYRYKNRQRSDDLPSEHYFAEGYYDCSSDHAEGEPMIDASN